MTTAELADFLQLSTRTLQRWRSCGYGPSYIRVRDHVRYPEHGVQSWMEERKAERRRGDTSR
ncbi:MAG: helix-turn-helix transcriptional regulator [Actinomycetota bacterium]